MTKHFFTSDYHGYHNNIIKLCSRPFANMDEMMTAIIDRHNSVVSDSDIIHDLGDFAYACHQGHVVDMLRALKGKRKILWGNHDKPLQIALKKGMLKEFLDSGKLELIGTPYPCQSFITEQINGQIFVLCHNALRSWNHSFRGSIHLFGHSHNNLPPLYKSRDVGVDTHNFFPWSENEIKIWADSVKDEFRENNKDNKEKQMDKQKVLNQIRDGHKFIEMLVQAFPKARNQANNIGWVLNAIKDEVNKPDVVPVVAQEKSN